MSYVSFITDEKYLKIVGEILAIGMDAKAKAESDFNRNVIDPFAMMIEMASFDIDSNTWMVSEKSRQAQKSLSNHVGLLHQKILGNVDGWRDMGTGNIVDLVNDERKIVAEVKNKHNTTKGSDKVAIYKELDDLVMPKASNYKDYTAYFVEIIPKKPIRYEECFTPSDRKKGTRCEANPKIKQTDGASFYTLVTGEEDALEQIFKTLPAVIKDSLKASSTIDSKGAEEFFKVAFVEKPSKPRRTSRQA